ncbi:MAG TPA: hypothetical protein VGA36_07805 [Nitriliruptorales bacterium]
MPPASWIQQDLRKVAGAASAGLVAGFVVNGVGSRLAMMLLARLNPQVTGLVSDDDFVMGQFTLGDTVSLVAFGTLVGVLGGLLYLTVRQLRFGPQWFRTASMTIGPAVVVGSMLVHTDGIDFRVLEPAWFAISLFVALPGVFAFAVMRLTDRWTRPEAWPMRTRRAWVLGLLPLVSLGPVLLLLAAGVTFRVIHATVPRVRHLLDRPAAPVTARLALIVVFALALRSLIADVVTLL